MFLNGYSVRVPEGDERAHGYVHLRHGQTYSLVLGNKSSCRCDVTVAIDGKDIGTWRMERGQTVTLERPANEAKLFTFYKATSAEGVQVGGGVLSDDRGLLRVTFVPEDTARPTTIMRGQSAFHASIGDSISPQGLPDYASVNCMASPSVSSGVTGLSGHSSQEFGVAGHMRLDHGATQVVNLRLVCVDVVVPGDPTVLRPVMAQSTPVPAPVG
jgi:hypothetical protein